MEISYKINKGSVKLAHMRWLGVNGATNIYEGNLDYGWGAQFDTKTCLYFSNYPPWTVQMQWCTELLIVGNAIKKSFNFFLF